MSFILNALRKSEQERQALQSETVTDKILLPQPPQNSSKTTKFFVFLIIANILIIACFVWFIRNSLIPTADTTAPAISTHLVQDTKPEFKAIAKSIEPKKPAQKAESKTASIAELMDGEKQETAPLPAKLPIAKKPVTEPAIAKSPKLPISDTTATDTIKTQPDASQSPPVTTGIPFLNDLSSEFRQTVPKFTLNVFVYSQIPEERFIMVDMVKYKTGQQIKDAMLLKEILPDSFVVDYRNRTFKIKRP